MKRIFQFGFPIETYISSVCVWTSATLEASFYCWKFASRLTRCPYKIENLVLCVVCFHCFAPYVCVIPLAILAFDSFFYNRGFGCAYVYRVPFPHRRCLEPAPQNAFNTRVADTRV
jgi:hypothetical protein